MILTLEQLRETAQGAAYVEEQNGAVRFHRFSSRQENLYQSRREDFWKKTFSTAGVKLCFQTTSPWMRLKVQAVQTMPRTYFAMDVSVDGRYIGSIDNYSHQLLPEDYTTILCEFGDYERRFDLGEGEKLLTVYFPWSADLRIKELELADGSVFVPVRPKKKLLALGDSITQGYDALHPSNRYTSLMAEALEAEECNKAIGGEVFFPGLAEAMEQPEPDYIIVAYGTNDWGTLERRTALANAHDFYAALRKIYPSAKLFALLPIWRKDRDPARAYGSFDEMRQDLTEIAESTGIPVIDCYDFVPKDPGYFADLRLHPNDRGFVDYAKNLADVIQAEL